MLNMITLFRNVCAHNERLYDFKVQSGVDIKYIKPYVQTNNNTYERERKRFFGLLVCCKQLVKGHEGQKFSHDLIKLINEAPITNNTNVKNIILTEMGLPNNWKDFLEQG